MKRVAALISIFAVPSVIAFSACAADVDWKVYGFASLSGAEICFYELRSIIRAPDRHLRVWTKCLAQKDLDAIDITREFSGRILEDTAQKVARSYVPPFATVENITADQSLT